MLPDKKVNARNQERSCSELVPYSQTITHGQYLRPINQNFSPLFADFVLPMPGHAIVSSKKPKARHVVMARIAAAKWVLHAIPCVKCASLTCVRICRTAATASRQVVSSAEGYAAEHAKETALVLPMRCTALIAILAARDGAPATTVPTATVYGQTTAVCPSARLVLPIATRLILNARERGLLGSIAATASMQIRAWTVWPKDARGANSTDAAQLAIRVTVGSTRTNVSSHPPSTCSHAPAIQSTFLSALRKGRRLTTPVKRNAVGSPTTNRANAARRSLTVGWDKSAWMGHAPVDGLEAVPAHACVTRPLLLFA